MKKLLLLALALTASLASAQSYGHAPGRSVGHAHRDHHYSHTHRPLPGPRLGWLPSAPAGYWATQPETVFVPGTFVASINHCGQTQLTFVPGHYETISRQVWIARRW